MVGNQKQLGSWDVSKALELTWHDEDVWAGSVELPVGVEIEFKVCDFWVCIYGCMCGLTSTELPWQ